MKKLIFHTNTIHTVAKSSLSTHGLRESVIWANTIRSNVVAPKRKQRTCKKLDRNFFFFYSASPEKGATTLSITPFSITTFSITTFRCDIQHNDTQHKADNYYAVCHLWSVSFTRALRLVPLCLMFLS